MENKQTQAPNTIGEDFNINELLERYLNQWIWFLISVTIAILISFTYLRYAVSQYKATTSALIIDDRKGGMNELSAFSDLAVVSGGKSSVDNEIEILKSRTIISGAVKELALNVLYISKGRVKEEDIYKNSPIKIIFSETPVNFDKNNHVFFVKGITNSTYALFNNKEVKIGDFKYGQSVEEEGAKFSILKKVFFENTSWGDDFKINITILPLEDVAISYKKRMVITSLSKSSSIIEISIVDPVKEKAVDFLNQLIVVYNNSAISYKNLVYENTSKFIEKRINFITEELGGVEKQTEIFKKNNRVTDIATEAGLFVGNAASIEKQGIELETQLKVLQLMTDYVKKSSVSELIPPNVMSANNTSSGSIDQYNQLILERNRLLKNAGSKNVVIQNINKKLETLKINLISGLEQQKNTLKITISDLLKQNNLAVGKISQIPTLEKEARSLGRQQQIKETLYLYLLQKREETAIKLAVTAPNAKVIDEAKAENNRVSPNSQIIYLVAIILGLLVPFSILFLLDLFDTKIKGRFDIEGKMSIPFLGDVPHLDTDKEIVNATSRTGTAEALRIIRTNLEFMLNQVPEGTAKVIFSTSTVPKEGKTFVAVNLAATIAASGKKVLLLGMDIRNPKIDEYLQIPDRGVTNYLTSKDGKLEDYIVKQSGFEAFYVLPSGIIPPNPAELLMGKKVESLFNQLRKEYDYVIVDTAPISLVTDTAIIAKFADAFVYVVRANYLDKRMLNIPKNLYNDNKLPNMSILLNDTVSKKGYGYSYGYGYGYGVEEVKIPWYKKIANKFAKEVKS